MSWTSVLVTSETDKQAGDFLAEQFLAESVFLLRNEIRNYRLMKALRIDKLRGAAFDENPHGYTIGRNGFVVFSGQIIS